MKITLPYPPSANTYWRNVRGRTVVSREARTYKKAVATLCAVAHLRPLAGPVVLSVTVYRPQRSGDLSNRLKVLEDALEGFAYENDSQVCEIHATRMEDKANPRAVVWVEPWIGHGVLATVEVGT